MPKTYIEWKIWNNIIIKSNQNKIKTRNDGSRKTNPKYKRQFK